MKMKKIYLSIYEHDKQKLLQQRRQNGIAQFIKKIPFLNIWDINYWK